MANYDFEIVADNIEEAKKQMQERAIKALTAVGIQASTLARTEIQNDPSRIDTGLLRNSITYALDGEAPAISGYTADRPSKYTGKMPDPGSYSGSMPKEGEGRAAVYIGSNVEYAIYVHEGTDRMPPNRFLKNAIQNNIGELSDILKENLSN